MNIEKTVKSVLPSVLSTQPSLFYLHIPTLFNIIFDINTLKKNIAAYIPTGVKYKAYVITDNSEKDMLELKKVCDSANAENYTIIFFLSSKSLSHYSIVNDIVNDVMYRTPLCFFYITSSTEELDNTIINNFEILEYDRSISNMNLSSLVKLSKQNMFILNDELIHLTTILENTTNTMVVSGLIDIYKDKDLLKVFRDNVMKQLAKSPALSILDPVSSNDVIGFDSLYYWAKLRFNKIDKVKPRGVLLLGVPGCGKSLFAKSLGHKLGLPTISYQPSASVQSLLGSTEANFRRDISIIDNIGKCIVFIDEIEKQLSGGKSIHNDTIQRAIGQFTSWLQDRNSDAFIVATANSLDSLPSELLRSGRFDEIFFVDLPSEKTRKKIIDFYIKKYFGTCKKDMITALYDNTINFTGADIENAVKEIYYTDNYDTVLHLKPYIEKFKDTYKYLVSVKDQYRNVDGY